MEILDVLLDAFLDTLLVFVVILLVYFVLSFVESFLAKKISGKASFSPLIGASVGLIPQCGFSIVAADLYRKKIITLGTMIAVFVACSDEAIPIMITNASKIQMVLPLLGIKFVVAVFIGYLLNIILKKKEVLEKSKSGEVDVHIGCCHHEIEEHEDDHGHEHEGFVKSHIVHPLLHSLKISAYVLTINVIFGLLIHFIGEENIKEFLNKNVYLTPLFACLVGLIPNCASSVILTELFISSSITFAATTAGLICNAGLGLVYLYKDREKIKENLLITGILFLVGIAFGYIILLIELSI